MEAQSLVIAGMGGRLMQSILTKDKEKTEDFEELILQPQSELALFPKFLRTEGYTIVQEEMILEGGKFPHDEGTKKAGIWNMPARRMCQCRRWQPAAEWSSRWHYKGDGRCLWFLPACQERSGAISIYFRQKEDILRLIHAMGGQEESERSRRRRGIKGRAFTAYTGRAPVSIKREDSLRWQRLP
ncbi:MAG: tRNA (adenine(22)-N(1))-methyltransferase TrmK [Lachnospiraceae bacterium]